MNKYGYTIFDIDGTLLKKNLIELIIQQQVIDGFLDKKYLEINEKLHKLLNNNKLSRDEASKQIVTNWANGLKNNYYDEIFKHTKDFVFKNSELFYSFVQPLIELLNKNYFTLLSSNEPQFVTQAVQDFFSFSDNCSTVFEINDNKFSGKVLVFNSTAENKKNSIYKNIKKEMEISFTFGDSTSDIGMFEISKTPVCINPSNDLKKVALRKKWVILKPEEVLFYFEKNSIKV